MSRRRRKKRGLARRYGHTYGAGITVAVHGTLTLSPEDLGTPEALGGLPVHELPPAVVHEIAEEIAPTVADAVLDAVEEHAGHDYYPVRPEY